MLDSDHAIFIAGDEVWVREQSTTSSSAFHLEPISKAIMKTVLKIKWNTNSGECRINFKKHQGDIFIFLRIADHLHFPKSVNLRNLRCFSERFGQPVKAHRSNACAWMCKLRIYFRGALSVGYMPWAMMYWLSVWLFLIKKQKLAIKIS